MTLDPYHRWLGIPASLQPPNHYRLLGLQEYEDKTAVIENAAKRQIAHVRTYQLAEYSELSQKILNELIVARSTLLSDKKMAYDLQLRHDLSRRTETPVRHKAKVPRIVMSPRRWEILQMVSAWAICLCLLPIVFLLPARTARFDKPNATAPELSSQTDITIGSDDVSAFSLPVVLVTESDQPITYSLSPDTPPWVVVDEQSGVVSLAGKLPPQMKSCDVGVRVSQIGPPHLGDEIRFKLHLRP